MHTKLSYSHCIAAQEQEHIWFAYSRLVKNAEAPKPDAKAEKGPDAKTEGKEKIDKKGEKGEKKENVDEKELAAAKAERDEMVKKLDDATSQLQAKINTYSAENPEFSQYKSQFEADLQAVVKGLGDVKKEAADTAGYQAVTRAIDNALNKTLFGVDFQLERTRRDEFSHAIEKKTEYLNKNFPLATPELFGQFLTALNAANPGIDTNVNGADNKLAYAMVTRGSDYPENIAQETDKMQDAFNRLNQIVKEANKHPELMYPDRKEVAELKKDIASNVIKLFGDYPTENLHHFLKVGYGFSDQDCQKYETTVNNHWADSEEYLTGIDQGQTVETIKTLQADKAVIDELMKRLGPVNDLGTIDMSKEGRPVAESGTPENPIDLGTQYIDAKPPPIDLGTQYIRVKTKPKAVAAAEPATKSDAAGTSGDKTDFDRKIPSSEIPNPTITARPQRVTVIRGDGATTAQGPGDAWATQGQAAGQDGENKGEKVGEKKPSAEAQYDQKYYKAYMAAMEQIFTEKQASDGSNPEFADFKKSYSLELRNAERTLALANDGGPNYKTTLIRFNAQQDPEQRAREDAKNSMQITALILEKKVHDKNVEKEGKPAGQKEPGAPQPSGTETRKEKVDAGNVEKTAQELSGKSWTAKAEDLGDATQTRDVATGAARTEVGKAVARAVGLPDGSKITLYGVTVQRQEPDSTGAWSVTVRFDSPANAKRTVQAAMDKKNKD